MGNKLTTGATKVPSQTKAKSTSAAQQLIDEQAAQATSALSDDALEAELRAAQETAMKIASGVDLLDQELKLEAQLAALDDEGIDDDAGGAGGTEGEEAGDDADGDLEGLDEEELAQLQDELRELERQVLGDEVEAADDEEPAVAQAAAGGGQAEQEDGDDAEPAVAAVAVAAVATPQAAPQLAVAAVEDMAAGVAALGIAAVPAPQAPAAVAVAKAAPAAAVGPAACGLDAMLEPEPLEVCDDDDGPPAGLLMG
eukprot:XP_001695442.1 predicted protein [Chlamydomonas reinhardtii]